ncbi:Stk1 family PASTA domain-containing Ser/Thr kinase [Actinomadura craniellae]|uniref:non-specific serine/threonine protein kinase n=1 Tax=Actinomadura craniellae TaxID=2231787 RepID=A0A365H1W4_9ACTN|nr:Stk1 family PASTA domain-containing Ser/Thr kinase [Actinomadura craniellae]RAY13091.1 Stk1 family PASTA domain-containing Ser/Thr kinase [Actinomadura craniellae]
MDTTVADPLVGQVLDGRYRIESRVARGGMATVYRARDLKLGRNIALKVMHQNLAQDDDFVRRFIGEAKAAAALSHPNVVAVYDQGTDGHHVFLAMEYVPGRTLRDLLDERGRLGPRTALEILQPALAALAAAHRTGLVHRDVKPENVLLTDDGMVKVADFGLARAETASKQTKTGLIIGTVGYLAPEQVVSGHADVRSDVYAAGIMLFEMLTGHQPHQADTPLAVAYKHVNEVVPPPSSAIPGLPPQLDVLVTRATGHDPARRPADAGQFLAAVTDVHATLPPDIDHRLQNAPQNVTSVLGHAPPPAAAPHTRVYQQPDTLPPVARGSFMDRLIDTVTGRYALIAVGALAVVVLGWAVWYQVSGQYDSIPKNIIGMSAEQAKTELAGNGLTVQVRKGGYSNTVPRDRVMSTDPAPGTDVKQGTAVTLTLSKGPYPREIPDVSGKSQDEATQALKDDKFEVGAVHREFSPTGRPVPKDQVIRTDPPAGRSHQPDKPVTLVLSNGVQLPDLTGQPRQSAEQQLRALGLAVKVEEQEQDGKPPGTVLSQNPPGGTGVNPGDTVTLTVQKGRDCPWWNPFCGNGNNNDPNQIPVPTVLGRSVDEARNMLQGAGFQVDVRHQIGSGRVLRQQPANGNAPRNSPIVIWH